MILDSNVIMIVQLWLVIVSNFAQREARTRIYFFCKRIFESLRSRKAIHQPVEVVALPDAPVDKFGAPFVKDLLIAERFAAFVLRHVQLERRRSYSIAENDAPQRFPHPLWAALRFAKPESTMVVVVRHHCMQLFILSR